MLHIELRRPLAAYSTDALCSFESLLAARIAVYQSPIRAFNRLSKPLSHLSHVWRVLLLLFYFYRRYPLAPFALNLTRKEVKKHIGL